MTCLDIRRRLHTDPLDLDEETAKHLRECPECGAAAARSARFEQALGQAVRVEVPENLSSRIIMRQSFQGRGRLWQRPWTLPAIAAALVLAAGVATMFGSQFLRERAIGTELLALVEAAPQALSAKGPVSPGDVAAALAPLGMSVSGELGAVRFASQCVIRGRLAGHLVLEGQHAPVTVFLVPRQHLADRMGIDQADMSSLVIPVEQGTIAIVGVSGEPLHDLAEQIRRSIRWPA